MCGLAGLACLEPGDRGAAHAAIVRAMCAMIAHRGPDDSGIASEGPVCLGSRRLSIIDLSPAGHMPMQDESGRWTIAYNGEVYNFEELRSELAGLGHRFHSRTDTEVVLRAWIQWGKDALPRLMGIFAFALWDRDTGELALVRDQYGIKPLYYLETPRYVLFCSEMKALVRQHPDPQIDRGALAEWSLYRNLDGPGREGLVSGIVSVMPGEVVTVREGVIAREYYYRPGNAVSAGEYRRFAAMPPERVVEEVDETLRLVVRQQMVSDVPAGTLLSGGLDSSLITAMAARHRPDLKAFHVSVAGSPEHDERRFAEEVCRDNAIELVPLTLDGTLFRRTLVKTVWLSDLPLTHPNSVAYHLVSCTAREHGVTVLLSGEGADELFGGYSWAYRRRRRLQRLQPLLRRMPQRLRDLLSLLTYADAGMPVMRHRFRDLLPTAVDMLDRFGRLDWEQTCVEAYGFVENPADRAVLGGMLADLGDFLTPLLRRLDRMSMGASVECRVPFLDPRLVEKAINLPLDYKVGRRADKWILKQVALRSMPRHLVMRRKMGFPLPLESYLRPFADPAFFRGGFCEETLGLTRRGLEHMVESWDRRLYGFFGLVTLEIWGRLHLRGVGIDDMGEHLARLEHGLVPEAA
ncbi:asparagine synthase (glutamine-hydrolyzing) [Marinimicrococcus flavescens]|uniref:asparagine synthase (glutamine-hydrolyzing) n=1 Tax=Marinimicrococcus flavescens TaxID=3031815 RepID=A0AAP3XSX0_9PROT|nr:asparagine synthase (glutamine-hydrolyzing) [Marinimicrococcus flavescens]